MKIVKISGLVLLIVFVVVQFVPTSLNQSDVIPPTDIMKTYDVPKQVEAIFKTSCYDCHSNNTNYPWYNKVQPMAWVLEDHINKGKEELDFSDFGSYSKRRQKSKLKSIRSQIEDDEMPLSSYTLIHRDAKLSESDKVMVVEWVNKIIDSL